MFFTASRFALHAARLLLAILLPLNALHAQMRSNPVHQGSGPLSDLSTNVGAGSGPVHERGRSVSEGSLGTIGGNSVRESVTGDVGSGPVSAISVGPVTSGQPVSGSGTMSDASAGAVKKDVDSSLGEEISQPLHELGPLQARLRGVRPLPSEPAAGQEPTEQGVQPTDEEIVPDEQEPHDDEQPEEDEEQAAEPEGAAPDIAQDSAAPQEQPSELAPTAEAEPPAQDSAAPTGAENDPRDAEERPATPGTAHAASPR